MHQTLYVEIDRCSTVSSGIMFANLRSAIEHITLNTSGFALCYKT